MKTSTALPIASLCLLLTSPLAAQPRLVEGRPDHVDVVAYTTKVRLSLAQADRMRTELVNRLVDWSKPEAVVVRQELAAAVPFVDRGGHLHYGRWLLDGAVDGITLTAAYPDPG